MGSLLYIKDFDIQMRQAETLNEINILHFKNIQKSYRRSYSSISISYCLLKSKNLYYIFKGWLISVTSQFDNATATKF